MAPFDDCPLIQTVSLHEPSVYLIDPKPSSAVPAARDKHLADTEVHYGNDRIDRTLRRSQRHSSSDSVQSFLRLNAPALPSPQAKKITRAYHYMAQPVKQKIIDLRLAGILPAAIRTILAGEGLGISRNQIYRVIRCAKKDDGVEFPVMYKITGSHKDFILERTRHREKPLQIAKNSQLSQAGITKDLIRNYLSNQRRRGFLEPCRRAHKLVISVEVRRRIAALRADGYSGREIAAHADIAPHGLSPKQISNLHSNARRGGASSVS